MASLYHLACDYFWPGSILLHAGIASLWLAAGSWRFSFRLLSVILSMSARAGWVWFLYGVKDPDPLHFGEPFNVCGIPIFMTLVVWLTSLGFCRDTLQSSRPTVRSEKLQIVDLMAWTAATALLLGPSLTFLKALTPSVLKDRITYDTTIAMAWGTLTWLSAMLIREWLINSPWSRRSARMAATLTVLAVICGLLIVGARMVSEIGPQDMAFNILSYLIPSTFAWCMATGWTLRELGVRLQHRSSRSNISHSAETDH